MYRNFFRSNKRSCLLLLVTVAVLLAATGCSVTLISAYDEQIDHSATTLQKEMDTFLTSIETAPDSVSGSYEHNRGFYSGYGVELRGLLVRAQSHDKNELSTKQIELMADNLEELRKSHASGPLTPEAVGVYRNLFNQGWGAILKLELAKKRVL
jgi:hypothetical protein